LSAALDVAGIEYFSAAAAAAAAAAVWK